MTKRLFYNTHAHRITLLSMALWVVVLMSVGYYVPKWTARSVSAENYYKIENPISVNPKMYRPCDKVRTLTRRIVNQDITITSTLQLVEVITQTPPEKPRGELSTKASTADNLRAVTQETYENIEVAATPDEGENISAELTLPCNIPNGDYFFRTFIKFQVNGEEKRINNYTEKFEVRGR